MQVSHNGIGSIGGTVETGDSAGARSALLAANRVATASEIPSASTPAQTRAAALPSLGGSEDTTTLSAAARSASSLLSKALAGDASQPGKVQQIAAAVVNGSYRVDPDQLTSTLIDNMLAMSAD